MRPTSAIRGGRAPIDGLDVIGHGDRGAVGIGRFEAGERQGRDIVAVGA
jgi:hypothetical protein